ncbi:ferredoxin [Vagococcus humatus]|uniref:Ferredoxin n=1 Tax=Vagococcus humatus TaxID=1889241 RepID=A0A3R9YKD0_9ENTE|nr:ferredoxin [Vagococcus humatus]RST89726.1 ferredoxin [Vagococcus humatus]
MKCYLEPEKCIACGLCQTIAGEIFDYTDSGLVLFKDQPTETQITLPNHLEDACLKAYQECPTRAIGLIKE